MKRLIYLLLGIFIFCFGSLEAQKIPELGMGFGIQNSIGHENVLPGTGGQLHFFYPLWQTQKFSLGPAVGGALHFSGKSPSIGSRGIPVESPLTSSLMYRKDGGKQQNFSWKAGPQINYKVGDLTLSGLLQAGQTYWNQSAYGVDQEIRMVDNEGTAREYKKEVYGREEVKESTFSLMPGLRVGYPLSDKIKIWLEGTFASSKTNVKERSLEFPYENMPDLPNPGVITERTLGFFQEAPTRERTIGENLHTLNYQVGLDFILGSGSSARKKQAQSRNNPTQSPVPALATNWSAPSKEKPTENKKALIPVSPKNNSHFSEGASPEELRWRLVGDKIAHPKYFVELARLDRQGKPIRTYSGKTDKTHMKTAELAPGELREGRYKWVVNEMHTGASSTPQFFSMSSCDFDYEIHIDSIICEGYEGEDRKYKVYFSTSYESATGDLTFTDPGSGLLVDDENGTSLNYSFIELNNGLQSQPGIPSSIEDYCIEVTVPSGANEIHIGIQGDDLGTGQIICRPGVMEVLDSLPDCVCTSCEEVEVQFEDVQIEASNAEGNQYLFSGDLISNVPLYGIEVQVLSYSYSSNPSGCTNGVSQIEESGMILRPNTTINGSTSIQFSNTTGNPNANPNASKVIKHLSDAAMTGAIPLNIQVGLPGPIEGLDASCCAIEYEVCFKIVVFYDENNCQSCVFTQCFSFNNQ